MVWIDSIDELQYYNQSPFADCYCDLMIDPSDMILQAEVEYSPTGQYALMVEVMQADGLVVLEDASSYFEWYVFLAPNGTYYMNIRALRFSPQMCANACFILQVTISRVETFGEFSSNRVIFQKYTERYCVDGCCLIAKGITIEVS